MSRSIATLDAAALAPAPSAAAPAMADDAAARNMRLAVGVTVLMVAIILVWLPLSRLRLGPTTIDIMAKSFLGVGLGYCAMQACVWRLRDDPSRIAAILATTCRRVALLLVFTLLFSALCLGGLTLSYLAASIGLPFQDRLLADIDAAFGFNWMRFLSAVNAYPLLSRLLTAAYDSTGALLVGAAAFLSLAGHRERFTELLAVLAIAILATGLLSALVPAAGAYVLFKPAASQFSSFSANAGMWHYDILMELRTAASPVIDYAKPTGLVTFPSFHTALGVITTYAVREHRLILIPVAIINAAMIVATLPEGGHHAVDLIAGAALALSAIGFVRFWGRRAGPATR